MEEPKLSCPHCGWANGDHSALCPTRPLDLDARRQEPELEDRVTEGFALRQPGNPTTVHVHKFADGNVVVVIETERPGLAPLRTPLRMVPKTIELLTDALFRAAHDPDVWLPLGEDPEA